MSKVTYCQVGLFRLVRSGKLIRLSQKPYNLSLQLTKPLVTEVDPKFRKCAKVAPSLKPEGQEQWQNDAVFHPSSKPAWRLRRFRERPLGPEGDGAAGRKGKSNVRIHYLEIVCRDVAAQCAAWERLHGLSFGPPVADLGQARVAAAPDGSLVGVRAPLAEHEQPVTRAYLEVADIGSAVREAEAAGAVVAYPPTRQGDTGTWAIYILGDVQVGLWQR